MGALESKVKVSGKFNRTERRWVQALVPVED